MENNKCNHRVGTFYSYPDERLTISNINGLLDMAEESNELIGVNTRRKLY